MSIIAKGIVLTFLISFFYGCSPSLVIKPVNYTWNLESVLKVQKDMTVKGPPKTLSFNVNGIYKSEGIDLTVSEEGREIRIIRGSEGYFYIVAEGFSNVYVFDTGENSLELYNKINIDKSAIRNPAFNYRDPYVQIIYNDGEKNLLLNKKKIISLKQKSE